MLSALGACAGRRLLARAAMLASAPCIEVPVLRCSHKHTSPLAVHHKQQYHSEHVTTVHLQDAVALTKDVFKYGEAASINRYQIPDNPTIFFSILLESVMKAGVKCKVLTAFVTGVAAARHLLHISAVDTRFKC